MTSIQLKPEAKRYIQNHGSYNPFTENEQGIQIERTPFLQRHIQLADIKSIENTYFIAKDGTKIPIRIYTPHTDETILPVILYFHGGGWAIGDLDYMDGGCQYLSKHSQAIIVNVDYRLAPEHPYPIPQQDAYDALNWIYQNPLQLPIDLKRLAVAGDSAGGNLAASIAVRAIEEQGPPIQALLLTYPALDATATVANEDLQFAKQYGLDDDELDLYYRYYVQGNERLTHPYVSPALYEKKALLPPTIIVSAAYDVLNHEGKKFIEELQQAGVQAERVILDGLIHSFFSKMDYFEQETEEATIHLSNFFHFIIQDGLNFKTEYR